MDEIDQENDNMRALMQAMDQELHHEGIGKEFERAPTASKIAAPLCFMLFAFRCPRRRT